MSRKRVYVGNGDDLVVGLDCSTTSTKAIAIDWLIRKVLKIDPLRRPGIYEQLEREARQVPDG